jgi:outer membrane lipoprotein SlyB
LAASLAIRLKNNQIDMDTHISKFPQSLMWVAGIAITLFCATGIAAFMGWIPNSMGRSAQDTDFTVPERPESADSRTTAVNAATKKPIASTTQPKVVKCPDCGRVESVQQVSTKGEGTGLGAAGGAVVGGLLGNQVGAGQGKDIATVIGAVGGVMAGNEIEKRARATTGYDITIRMNDGSTRVIHQSALPAWRAGDPIKLVSGSIQSN